VRRWVKRYGEEFTEKLLIENNRKPKLSLRVNNLVTNKEEMKKLLDSVELRYKDGRYLNDFITLYGLTNITDWEYFSRGYFSVQDESTGLPCELLDVQPGMKILDLCAAPGGKTGILAAKMKNEGELVAVDKYESRLKILEKNLDRLKIKNVRTVAVDALEFEEEGFDRILIDAPCSGLGTLTKKPDIKWKRDVGDIGKLNVVQSDLLRHAAKLVKPGGYIVYSTCTIEPEENFEIVKEFLRENPDFTLADGKDFVNENLIAENGCVQTYPHIHGVDGSFAAKLKREK
jgi:16S rRNA (cytosine967-C5)-methyltransferase